MNMWRRIGEAVEVAGGRFVGLMGWLGGLMAGIGDPELRRQVAFSVALIALSAKMAKADGVVTSDEVAAFRALFAVPASEERSVTRLFQMAQRDVAGYRTYASRIATLYADDRQALEDVIDGLFSIAKADGAVHDAELTYLEDVASIFGFDGREFERITLRHVVLQAKAIPTSFWAPTAAWPMTRNPGASAITSWLPRTILTA